MKRSRSRTCGIEWYRPEDWTVLKACVSDPESMEDTYELWLAGVSRKMKHLMERGINIRKIWFNMSEWMEWCRQNNRPPDGKSRAEFVEAQMNRPGPVF